MQKWIETRSERLAAFFGRPLDTMWITDKAVMPEISTEMEEHLGRLNFEWHIIPTNEAMPLDEAYYDRLYLMRPPYFSSGRTIPGAYGACSNRVMRDIRDKLLRSRPP